MAGPLLLALGTGESVAGAYLFSGCVTVFAGICAYIVSGERRSTTDFRSALLFVLIWWTAIPVFAALPLLLAGFTAFDAYFEAVSALTTTGAWLSNESIEASGAGLLWRAELQWLGGLASLAFAAAIFIRPAFVGIDTLLPPFSRGDRDSFLRPVRNAVAAFWGPYALITAIAFASMMLAGLGAFDAAITALSVVASGGIVPPSAGFEAYPASAPAVYFPFLLLSGANFVLIARVLRGAERRARDVETGGYIVIALGVGVLFWATAGAVGVERLPLHIFNAASLLSTNGVIIGEAPPLTVAMVTAIIGGAAVSTAGGFKVLRWLVIMRRAREELRLLVDPRGVFGPRRESDELGVWMHFLVFTMTLAALVLIVTAGGHSLETATAAATAILSNTGPLLSLAENAGSGYEMFSAPIRALLIVGMILGRLEAVAALALINRAFWRA